MQIIRDIVHDPKTRTTLPKRPDVAKARRVVIKLGTRVLVNDDGSLAVQHLRSMVTSVARLIRNGRSFILVSSGAVGLGRALLEGARGLGPNDRQAHAAVGQGHLMGRYCTELERHGLTCAQVLVTEQDFETRKRYLDLRQTLQNLLRAGVVPVLNDNDVVSHGARTDVSHDATRAVFDDNDRLAALVAAKCDADLLLILTDVAGVFDRDPKYTSDASHFAQVQEPELLLEGLSENRGSNLSRGGMRSKIESAIVAQVGGCQVVIASGQEPTVVEEVLNGEEIGTWIPALRAQPARRSWIAFAAVPKGVLRLDAGAVRALREKGASLLPVGVRGIEGQFQRGDVVDLKDPDGALIGRAWMDFSVEQVRSWCNGRPPKESQNCLVRRDYIVLRSNE
ncbi:MAG: glutamate 5-kinase [bacterium]|nr:glutamate 5-kinase [bacterium]